MTNKELNNFNSIKVRLERFLAILRTCVLPYFNSIKVRLEHIYYSYVFDY